MDKAPMDNDNDSVSEQKPSLEELAEIPNAGKLQINLVRKDFYARLELLFLSDSYAKHVGKPLKPGEAKALARGILNTMMAFAISCEDEPELLQRLASWGAGANINTHDTPWDRGAKVFHDRARKFYEET